MASHPETSGIAWIAGIGASVGLGAALARRYARGGLRVALTGRTPAQLHLQQRSAWTQELDLRPFKESF